MSNTELSFKFEQAMYDIYKRALKEASYKASLFHQMLSDHGGLQTAKKLINANTVSDGFTKLWEKKRIDLTVEAVIFNCQEWHPLFTSKELEICQKRLKKYGYI